MDEGPSVTPPRPLLPLDAGTASYHLGVGQAPPRLSAEAEYCLFHSRTLFSTPVL